MLLNVKIGLQLLMLILLATNTWSQGVQAIGNPATHEATYAVTADDAGFVYSAGSGGNQGLIIKLDPNNQVVWSKSLGTGLPASNYLITSFLDLVADTVFGCGYIRSSSATLGGFYFKMNKNTGQLYWWKSENTFGQYYSGMRYDQGKFFLAGAKTTTNAQYNINVLCVNSSTGDYLWQTGTKGFEFPAYGNDYIDDVMGITRVVNGTFYLTGRSYVNAGSYNMRVTLFGFDTNGNLFLSKYLMFDQNTSGNNRFYGMSIDFDGTDSLVLCYHGDDNCGAPCNSYYFGMIKTDLNGNISFAKSYDVVSSPRELVKSLNITGDAYVFTGATDYNTTDAKLVVIKTDKNGVFQKMRRFSQTGSTFQVYFGGVNTGGSSKFSNGIHYFGSGIHYGNPNLMDMLVVQMDEDLNCTNPCFEVDSLDVVTINHPTFSGNLDVNNVNQMLPASVTSTNAPDYTFFEDCDTADIVFNQVSYGCDSVVVNWTSIAGLNYEAVWSTGEIGNAEAFYQDTTGIVTFYNLTNCCYFSDTVEVDLPSGVVPDVNLPNDTTLCIAVGQAFDIVPEIVNCNGCMLEWDTGSSDTVLSVVTSGWYSLSVSNSCGGSDEDSIYIEMNAEPIFTIPNDTLVCAGSMPLNYTLQVSNVDSIVWSNGTNGTAASILDSGSVSLTIYSECDVVTEYFSIGFIEEVSIAMQDNIDTCLQSFGDTIPIPLSVLNADLVLVNGAPVSGAGIDAFSDSTFLIEASNSCSQEQISFSVEISYWPVISNLTDTSVCLSDLPLELNVSSQYADSVVWSNGMVGSIVSYPDTGLVSAIAYGECGSDTISFIISSPEQVELQPIADIDSCLQSFDDTIMVTLNVFNADEIWVNGIPISGNTIAVYSDSMYSIEASNLCSQDQIQFSSLVSYFPQYDFIPEIDTCLELGTSLDLNVSTTNGTVSWWDGTTGGQHAVTQSGIYHFQVSNSCGAVDDSIIVTYQEPVEYEMPDEINACVVENEGIYVISTSPHIVWELWDSEDSIYVDESGVYYYQVIGGCETIDDSIVVVLVTIPHFSINDSIHVCTDEFRSTEYDFNANGPFWLLTDEGNPAGDVIMESGNYQIVMQNECATIVDTFYLDISPASFYAPNAFTPNGDELNNVYRFYGDRYRIHSVNIYDRWGEKVFSEEGTFSGWDGSYKGRNCQDGIYTVHVIYSSCDDIVKELHLHVNLLR